MRHRVTGPRVPVDYCDRPELIKRCALTERPVTVVMAPGGIWQDDRPCRVLRRRPRGWRADGVADALERGHGGGS